MPRVIVDRYLRVAPVGALPWLLLQASSHVKAGMAVAVASRNVRNVGGAAQAIR